MKAPYTISGEGLGPGSIFLQSQLQSLTQPADWCENNANASKFEERPAQANQPKNGRFTADSRKP